jgi:hypothetical protein
MAHDKGNEGIMKLRKIDEAFEGRELAAAADPLEVQSLAIAYKITPVQVRALLLRYSHNWPKFDQAATQLRSR